MFYEVLPNPKIYHSLVGGLMYTLITRPDVAVAVIICARYLKEPHPRFIWYKPYKLFDNIK